MADDGATVSVPRVGKQQFVAGVLCLDFVNTVDWRGSLLPHDRLASYGDLVIWCGEAGLIKAGAITRLVALAVPDPDGAADVLRRAVSLREAVYRAVQAASTGVAIADADLDVLNDELARGPVMQRLVLREGRVVWDYTDATTLDAMLPPIARSAAELLTGEELDRVKQCADRTCGWLFVDLSRARRRRWCSMESCGNRAKARRHYRRQKSAVTTAEA